MEGKAWKLWLKCLGLTLIFSPKIALKERMLRVLIGEDTALVSTLCELKPTFVCLVQMKLSPAGWTALPGRRTRPSCTKTPSPIFTPECISLFQLQLQLVALMLPAPHAVIKRAVLAVPAWTSLLFQYFV